MTRYVSVKVRQFEDQEQQTEEQEFRRVYNGKGQDFYQELVDYLKGLEPLQKDF